MSAARAAWRLLGIVLIVVVLYSAILAWKLSNATSLPVQPPISVAAAGLLTQAILDSTPNAEQLRRGQYLVREGDCLSCHLSVAGQPFAGGVGINTPFGVIYSSNITSDRKTGIGDWTPEQFYAAMHDGRRADGKHLYPAFPYPWFTRVSRADDDAILAFLKTTEPVEYTPPANALPFPFNVRAVLAGWNLLFLKRGEFAANPQQSAEWNRGAQIVNGLGHCSACHTPKNAFGADKSSQAFHGASLESFIAPDLTGNERTGLGSWTEQDIVEYLRTGRNGLAGAAGPMADVITYSTSLMEDQDLHAIAVYLKGIAPTAASTASKVDQGALRRGAAIYSDTCSSCHLNDGVGQPRLFAPLNKSAVVQQPDPSTVLHFILAGARIGPSPLRPSPLSMPSFAWKLTDQEIADVATFIRNSWGNQASAVRTTTVREMRKKLDLLSNHLTENSGDR